MARKDRDKLLGGGSNKKKQKEAEKVPLMSSTMSDDDSDSSFYNQQMMQQDEIIAQQDVQIQYASEATTRIKQIAITIGDELDDQNKQLKDLSDDVDHTQSLLNRTSARLEKLLSSGGDKGKVIIIIVLIAVLVVLILAVVDL